MSDAANTREDQIARELTKCAATVKRAGNRCWEFALTNGRPLGVSARIVEDWLVLEAQLSERIAQEGWFDLLRLNGKLPGLSKFVMPPRSTFRCPTNFSLSNIRPAGGEGSGVAKSRQTEVCRTARSIHLRADIPLVSDEDNDRDYGEELNSGLMTRLQQTCLGLKASFHSFQRERTVKDQAIRLTENQERNFKGRLEDLRDLCGDTGWSFNERSGGKLMVDLDVKGGYYRAALEQLGDGAEISVEVSGSNDLGETSRQALSLLLLETGGLVRLARPSITADGTQISARFDVKFATMPAVDELVHAFASLSVACALSGREARALQDEVIARDYLAIQGAPTTQSVSSSAAGD